MKISPVTIRMPDELRKEAKVKAAEADTSLNAWVVKAIEEKAVQKTGGEQ